MEQPKITGTDRFVAVGISLLTMLFLLCFAFVAGLLGLDRSPQGNAAFISVAYLAVLIPLGIGIVYRSSRRAQFHACFWSGLGLLIATFLLVVHIIRNEPDGPRTETYMAAISFVALTILVGQALLMTALFRDPLATSRRW